MHETPAAFNDIPSDNRRYPAEDLSGFRWHTGASLRAIAQEEVCPVLFRDIGPAAMALFLRGQLRRLAGPLSPLVYMRTAGYAEPYTDHEHIGRLVLLRPLRLHPWHAGTPHVYVARAYRGIDSRSVGFIPGNIPLAEAARLAKEVNEVKQLREVLGGKCYDEVVRESLLALDRLGEELAGTEVRAAPLRRRLQSPNRTEHEQTQAAMERVGLTEADLCTAWHHLPRERRTWIADTLRRLDSYLPREEEAT